MAKWSKDWPGQRGHIHLSLWRDGKQAASAFHDAKAPHRHEPDDAHFVAGQQALMPELLAMVAPTVNSYTPADPRLLGADLGHLGRREPHHARCASSPARRSRSASSTALPPPTPTPIWPWRRRWDPGCGASRTSSSWASRSRATLTTRSTRRSCDLPRTLMEAAQRLKAPKRRARCSATRSSSTMPPRANWEEREFRKAITDWELARYFEII